MANRNFALGTLAGLPIAVYAVHQAVNVAFGRQIEPPSEAVEASVAMLAAGSVALGLAHLFPSWFLAIEGGEITIDDPIPKGQDHA